MKKIKLELVDDSGDNLFGEDLNKLKLSVWDENAKRFIVVHSAKIINARIKDLLSHYQGEYSENKGGLADRLFG